MRLRLSQRHMDSKGPEVLASQALCVYCVDPCRCSTLRRRSTLDGARLAANFRTREPVPRTSWESWLPPLPPGSQPTVRDVHQEWDTPLSHVSGSPAKAEDGLVFPVRPRLWGLNPHVWVIKRARDLGQGAPAWSLPAVSGGALPAVPGSAACLSAEDSRRDSGYRNGMVYPHRIYSARLTGAQGAVPSTARSVLRLG